MLISFLPCLHRSRRVSPHQHAERTGGQRTTMFPPLRSPPTLKTTLPASSRIVTEKVSRPEATSSPGVEDCHRVAVAVNTVVPPVAGPGRGRAVGHQTPGISSVEAMLIGQAHLDCPALTPRSVVATRPKLRRSDPNVNHPPPVTLAGLAATSRPIASVPSAVVVGCRDDDGRCRYGAVDVCAVQTEAATVPMLFDPSPQSIPHVCVSFEPGSLIEAASVTVDPGA